MDETLIPDPVVDAGSAMSHAAIVAREYGVPAVMGTGDAMQRLQDGQRVIVDGTRGLVFAAGASEGSGERAARVGRATCLDRREHCVFEPVAEDGGSNGGRDHRGRLDTIPKRGNDFAHRRAVDRVRSEQLQQDRMSDYGAASVETPRNIPLEVVVHADEARTLRTCLGELTDLQRSSIEMSYFGGLTYPEVAQQTETPLPTVKSRIRDGLRRLRQCLRTQEDA